MIHTIVFTTLNKSQERLEMAASCLLTFYGDDCLRPLLWTVYRHIRWSLCQAHAHYFFLFCSRSGAVRSLERYFHWHGLMVAR